MPRKKQFFFAVEEVPAEHWFENPTFVECIDCPYESASVNSHVKKTGRFFCEIGYERYPKDNNRNSLYDRIKREPKFFIWAVCMKCLRRRLRTKTLPALYQ